MEISTNRYISRLRTSFMFKKLFNISGQIRNCTFGPRNISNCYMILGIPDKSDQEIVRQAFLDLVKRFHPDSKSPEADSLKFQQIETAYRTLQENFARLRFKTDDCEGEFGLYHEEKIEEQEIQHTAPQHRQYLNYGGYGSGTPAQRERQYTQFRAAKAVENVTEYRLNKLQSKYSKELISKNNNKKKVKDIRTRFGMDRLVEDLIQESMTRGEFDNLSGAGKPLKGLHCTHNPYVDFVTHKMNEVLIDNGFTPQWITLQKEIRDQLEDIKETLKKVRKKLGPLPLDDGENEYWLDEIKRNLDRVKDVNSKIDLYNLVVPILDKQMLHINLALEAEKILIETAPGKKTKIIKLSDEDLKNKNDKKHLLDIVNYFFEK